MTESYVPKVGDRIRVTREGVVTKDPVACGYLYLDGFSVRMDIPNTTVELLAPAEPPVGSVVVTRSTRLLAWLRTSEGWCAVGTLVHTWAEVTDGRTVVHVETPDGA